MDFSQQKVFWVKQFKALFCFMKKIQKNEKILTWTLEGQKLYTCAFGDESEIKNFEGCRTYIRIISIEITLLQLETKTKLEIFYIS